MAFSRNAPQTGPKWVGYFQRDRSCIFVPRGGGTGNFIRAKLCPGPGAKFDKQREIKHVCPKRKECVELEIAATLVEMAQKWPNIVRKLSEIAPKHGRDSLKSAEIDRIWPILPKNQPTSPKIGRCRQYCPRSRRTLADKQTISSIDICATGSRLKVKPVRLCRRRPNAR